MIRFEFLEGCGCAVAAMSDKSDGDCGIRGDRARQIRGRLCKVCGVDANGLVVPHQVHGMRIAYAHAPGVHPATDGLISDVRGLPLTVVAADCVPVFLVAPGSCAVGLVHAGRRGTRANIAGKAVATLGKRLDVAPWEIHALVGPSAGPCCYEVSAEMAEDFVSAGLPAEGRRLDLWQANAQQLAAAGVPEAQVVVAGICTICDGRFHSYRAGSATARNMAMLVL
ncbi:MAG TPA: laccase domain-containing protein [Candidatus Hydrogenedentes bacterium]|nr:laccase domain-containing protein [Candidatus Hydrogenedentota bacterium]